MQFRIPSISRTFISFIASAILALPQFAAGQSFQVIHNFTGGADGGVPPYTLAEDAGGHFFGTANSGGRNGTGIVFKLIHSSSSWVLSPLYNFSDQDGQPGWGVTLAPDGTIYTSAGYASVLGGPCGSALHLQPSPTPPRSVFVTWNETLLWTYVKHIDGCPTGNLVLDATGNVYGVTQDGGANGWGSIFQLTHSGSTWTENILYSFTGQADGGAPYSALIRDSAGNFYGTATAAGANGFGTVFELSPNGSGWTYNVLYTFTGGNDGAQPVAGLIFDSAGNLYGATTSRGANGGGTIFKLTPSGGSWSFSVLGSLSGTDGPVASLTMDNSGNLYGTAFMDGAFGYGQVFKLTNSGGTWIYTDLHDFSGGADGGYPGGGVTLDASGNVLGTAVLGGSNSQGVIYEITP